MLRISLATLVLASLPLSAQPYMRAGIGIERSGDITLRDVDCSSTQPPALFGCGNGPDGLTFGARGDLGTGAAFEIAGGHEAGRIRFELGLVARSGFTSEAEANFTGVTGSQTVHADVRALSAMLFGALDVAPAHWRVRPFVTAGAGVSRNETGRITFAFPGIAPEAVTILRGGTETSFAWRAGAGVSVALDDNLTLDLAAYYTDLGEIRTEHGNATIVRPNRRLTLDIAAIEAQLQTTGLSVSVRQRF